MVKTVDNWNEFQASLKKNVQIPENTETEELLEKLYKSLVNSEIAEKRLAGTEIRFVSIIKWYLVAMSQCFNAVKISRKEFTELPIFKSPFFPNNCLSPTDASTCNAIKFRLSLEFRTVVKYLYFNVLYNTLNLACAPLRFIKLTLLGRYAVCIEPNKLVFETIKKSGYPVLFLPVDIFFKLTVVGLQSNNNEVLEKTGSAIRELDLSFLTNGEKQLLVQYSTLWLEGLSERLVGIKIRNLRTDHFLIGRACSNIKAAMLARTLRDRKIRVVTFDHGSGNSHHDQTPVHWVEYINSDVFVTTNSFVAKERQRQFNSRLVFGSKPTVMIGWKDLATRLERCKSLTQLVNSVAVDSEEKIDIKDTVSEEMIHNMALPPVHLTQPIQFRKVLYISTAFHGWRTRLRPVLFDGQYLNWQIVLLNELKDKFHFVSYRAHPEGSTAGPTNIVDQLGVSIVDGDFNDITLKNFDLIVFDFIFSSVIPQVFRSGVPLLFLNPGYPKLTKRARSVFCNDINFMDIDFSNNTRSLRYDIRYALQNCTMEKVGLETYQKYFDFHNV